MTPLHLRIQAALGAVALSYLGLVGAHAAPATIDLAASRQVIRGFGGATAFQPPETDPYSAGDLDRLFGNGPGQLGFTILRIRLAPDDGWRQTELQHALAARARGAIVVASPWSPPASMKTNNNLVGGSLDPSKYGEYAAYLNDFIAWMAAEGVPLHAISIQNEPDIEVTYESCDWTPAQMLAFCRDHARTITGARVMAPESFQFRKNISDPLLNDEFATANIDIIAGHIYGGGLAAYPLAESRAKEIWMTEHLVLDTDWPASLATGREIHDCLVTARFNAYLWWYLKRFYGPIGQDGAVTKRGWVMAHFAKFVRPGLVRVEATASPATNVFVSAFRGEQLVIVAINQGAAAVEQEFIVQGGGVATVTPWTTSETLNLEAGAAIPLVGGTFTATLPARSITTFVGERALSAPTILTPPRSLTLAAGSAAVLAVEASGEFVSYQWRRDGADLPGETSRQLTIDAAGPGDAGSYTVRVANAAGSVTSAPAALTVQAGVEPGRLVNISTRSPVGTGEAVQIGGFVVSGSQPAQVLVRAAGPVLGAEFGVAGALADPRVDLYDQGSSTVLTGNDDWEAALAPTFADVGAFPWPAGSRDAALVTALPAGGYTAVVRATDDASTGVALVEVYEIPGGAPGGEVVNLSSRTLVGSDDAVQIAGFVIGGTAARTVLIRASGPALARLFTISGALWDPVLELRDQRDGALLATADGWDAQAGAFFEVVGAFGWPLDSRDAALVVTLPPGPYTAIVRDRGNGTGVALVEVYALP